MKVNKQGDLVLDGTRNEAAGMWQVKRTTTQPRPTPTHQSAKILLTERRKPYLTQWYHSTPFSPAKHSLIQAIKKSYFSTCPNLTSDLINKHLPPSVATDKVRMHQTRKNLKSTKPQDPKTLEDPPMKPLVQRTNIVFTKIIDHKRQIATDHTVKFTVTLNTGNKYIFVLYYYDSNITLIRPIKSRLYSSFVQIFRDLHSSKSSGTYMGSYSPGVSI